MCEQEKNGMRVREKQQEEKGREDMMMICHVSTFRLISSLLQISFSRVYVCFPPVSCSVVLFSRR